MNDFFIEVIDMGIIYAIGRWSLLFLSLGMSVCLFTILIFSLMKAGRRADEGEEKILEILSSARPSSDIENATAQISEVSVAR